MIIQKAYIAHTSGDNGVAITIPSVLGIKPGTIYYFEKREGSDRLILIPAEEIENKD